MLEVHAILHRQRCNENMTEKTGTLSDAYYLGLSQVKVKDNDYSPILQSKSLERVFWCGSPFKVPALKELRKLRPDIVIGGNLYNEIYFAKKSKQTITSE